MSDRDDTFDLYDLRVEVVATDRPMVCGHRAGDWFELQVEDEGNGLPDTSNLFVPFFTTKPNGSGIGLALSRQLAEAHGGTMSLEPRTNGPGCRATLRLPMLMPAGEPPVSMANQGQVAARR